MMRSLILSVASSLILAAGAALAADAPTYTITLSNHGVAPATLTVPAGERVKLHIKNTRSQPSEFESAELSREKVVPGGTTLDLWIGPLKPGKYKYIDEFNPPASGWIEATEQH